MPSLPELGDIFADKRISEIFFKMKAEYSAQADCNIRISRKIKIIPKGYQHRSVPCSQNRKRLYRLVPIIGSSETGSYNAVKIVGYYDLFPYTQYYPRKAVR